MERCRGSLGGARGMTNLEKTFRRASTVDEKANAIIDYLIQAGLTPDQMLEVLRMARERLEGLKR